MRIAYIAPYQGPGLRSRRPTLGNLALAGNLKIELVAELLCQRGHEVEIISQGEVIENVARYFPGFVESRREGRTASAFYASALPVRFLNGWWSTSRTLALFKRRHRSAPFDLAIIYNLKPPQVECARLASRRLGLPVVVEYEDDAFVNLAGVSEQGPITRHRLRQAQGVLDTAAGCIGVSPFLLSRFRAQTPGLLLRGVVSDNVLEVGRRQQPRANRVVFSGTLFRSKGLEPLISAWPRAGLQGWELHIAGDGELATRLREQANGDPSIVFHGLLGREENAALLGSAAIGINPHDLSATPGNVFAFKIIEYLAAGAHVITTPMGQLEPELEHGITYIPDNEPDTIADALRYVVTRRLFERNATRAAHDAYGPEAVGQALDGLLRNVLRGYAVRREPRVSSDPDDAVPTGAPRDLERAADRN